MQVSHQPLTCGPLHTVILNKVQARGEYELGRAGACCIDSDQGLTASAGEASSRWLTSSILQVQSWSDADHTCKVSEDARCKSACS